VVRHQVVQSVVEAYEKFEAIHGGNR